MGDVQTDQNEKAFNGPLTKCSREYSDATHLVRYNFVSRLVLYLALFATSLYVYCSLVHFNLEQRLLSLSFSKCKISFTDA